MPSSRKLLARNASLLRSAGNASLNPLPMSMPSTFDKRASKRESSVKVGLRNHDLGCKRSNVLIAPSTELCLDPPATTVLSRKGGRSGSFGFWLRRFAFLKRFFWFLVKVSVIAIFKVSYFYLKLLKVWLSDLLVKEKNTSKEVFCRQSDPYNPIRCVVGLFFWLRSTKVLHYNMVQFWRILLIDFVPSWWDGLMDSMISA